VVRKYDSEEPGPIFLGGSVHVIRSCRFCWSSIWLCWLWSLVVLVVLHTALFPGFTVRGYSLLLTVLQPQRHLLWAINNDNRCDIQLSVERPRVTWAVRITYEHLDGESRLVLAEIPQPERINVPFFKMFIFIGGRRSPFRNMSSTCVLLHSTRSAGPLRGSSTRQRPSTQAIDACDDEIEQ
jgi:hypothetical protein